MKTCRQFAITRNGYEREIQILSSHSERHADKPSGKASAKRAITTREQMARALSSHVGRCPECG
ncbi:hypothetical protein [Streptomyces orinoci]|uniref:Uncharacterized protein n=1 Tax=Streptomyces orinoci TaxID=67339 RepID=A0ABV3JUQ3_STRON|nr:hypothetical protein [Streptomyces orinoci]